jgi:uncharacterized membrane protein YbhN (UPF0104 family)
VGALSLIPGGIGAYEASVLGLLVAIGLDPAAALLHRVVDKDFATVLGFTTYAAVRHRLRLTSIVATRPARHIRVEGLKGVPGM